MNSLHFRMRIKCSHFMKTTRNVACQIQVNCWINELLNITKRVCSIYICSQQTSDCCFCLFGTPVFILKTNKPLFLRYKVPELSIIVCERSWWFFWSRSTVFNNAISPFMWKLPNSENVLVYVSMRQFLCDFNIIHRTNVLSVMF